MRFREFLALFAVLFFFFFYGPVATLCGIVGWLCFCVILWSMADPTLYPLFVPAFVLGVLFFAFAWNAASCHRAKVERRRFEDPWGTAAAGRPRQGSRVEPRF